MNLGALISPQRIACDVRADTKKHALITLGELLANAAPELRAADVYASLAERERAGSTGLGRGVALPHGRPKGCRHAAGAFVKLAQGVDFGAADGQPADLVFALLVPEHFTDEHLQILACLAETFSDQALCRQLRQCRDAGHVYQLLAHWQPYRASA